MKRFVPLTFALLATPFAAIAGGPVTPTAEPQIMAPMTVAPTPVTGAWTGFYGGLSLGIGDLQSNAPGNDENLGIAGVNLGYRYDWGQAVVGGELSYDYDNLSGNSGDTNRVNNTAALKVILGKAMGRTLVYASLGVVQADANIGGISATDTGYTVGIGADYALNERWTIGGELATNRYDQFSNTGYNLNDTTLKAKIAFRF